MKLTKSKLKQIIKEELEKVLREGMSPNEFKGRESLDARIWISRDGYSDPPMSVDENDFIDRLQYEFDKGKPTTFEDAENIFNDVYDSMEEAAAGWDI